VDNYKLRLEQGKWHGIPGMSQELADFAKLTEAYNDVLSVAQQITEVNSEVISHGEDIWKTPINNMGVLVSPLLDDIEKVQEWMEDFPKLMRTSMQQGTNVVENTFGRKITRRLQRISDSIKSDTVKKMFDEATVGIRAAVTELNILSKTWEASFRLDPNSKKTVELATLIQEFKNDIIREYLPLLSDVLSTISGSTEAAERLVDRLTNALIEAGGPADSVQNWWDWVSRRLALALEDFHITDQAGSVIGYSGAKAADEYISGLEGRLEGYSIVASLVGDPKSYKNEIKKEAQGILGILNDMFSQAAKNAIPKDQWFKENDDIVEGLVAAYIRLSAEAEDFAEKVDEWLPKWLGNFGKILDAHKEFVATYARDELGQINAVVDYQRNKSKEEAIKSLDEQMKNWEEVQRTIRDTYGLEFETKKELYDYVRKLIDEQYDYEEFRIKRTEELRKNAIKQQMLSVGLVSISGDPQTFEERLENAKKLYGLQVAAAMQIVDAAERELALKQAAGVWNATVASINQEILSARLATLSIELQLMQAQLGFTSGLEERLKLVNEIYDQRMAELKLTLEGNDLKLAAQVLELERQKAITGEYIKQYQILLQGNQEYWNAVEEGIARNIQSGDLRRAVAGQMQMGMQGTQMGSLMAGGDPVLMLIQGFMEAARQVESFNDVLNGVTTIFEGMMSVIGSFLDSVFKPFSDLLKSFGAALGGLVAITMMLMPRFHVLRIVIGIVADALKWFYNKVIVPLGNAIINTMNAVIRALNRIPFVSIALLDLLDPLVDNIEEYNSALKEAIDYLTGELKDWVNRQVGSIQDLYEVGAITGEEYQRQVQDIMDKYGSYIEDNNELAKFFGDLSPDGIVSAIDLLREEQSNLEGTANTAVDYLQNINGLLSIIADNQSAVIDVGDSVDDNVNGGTAPSEREFTVMPDDVVSSSENPSFSLFGPNKNILLNPNEMRKVAELGGVRNVYVTVEGSVIAARDLAEELNGIMETQTARGYITRGN
jgi:Ni,Fe-hydrogenase III component G